jgi:hypothetical protein
MKLTTIALVCSIAGISTCAFGFLGIGGHTWKEEALLHDGSKIIVERFVERGGRHEIGQKGAYIKQSLTFILPATGDRVEWIDSFSEDIGSASFLPMLLDVMAGVPYLVAKPMGCLSYNKWGRPNPPYVIFKYREKGWGRVPLAELPAEINTPNLISSAPDMEVERTGKNFFSAEMIQAFTASYKSDVSKTILREAYPGASGNCGEMAGNGKGHWLGMDWFKEQPSREACLKYCERKEYDAQHCPCDSIFDAK